MECVRSQRALADWPSDARRTASVAEPPHRQPQRVVLVQDVDRDGAGRGTGVARAALTSRSAARCAGRAVGTSVRCARSTMTVGLPAARQRSHGPETSRAVGHRRFSATSHAAMQSVNVSSDATYPVTVTQRGQAEARDVGREVVVLGHRTRRAAGGRRAHTAAWRRTRPGSAGSACPATVRRSTRRRWRPPGCRSARGARREAAPVSSADSGVPWPSRIGTTAALRHVGPQARRRSPGCGPRRAWSARATSRVIGHS